MTPDEEELRRALEGCSLEELTDIIAEMLYIIQTHADEQQGVPPSDTTSH